ncbi:hypothetical protein Dsin_029213 [Dipteronia sinensis]|uniref:MULE transposase domain-containing protein n=1 Tax=Dipteronia sinensis TaxID=43782 RepID=A0AAD9ZTB6_9ROSI|nr:hypothetical protein Dsin_029213 [Dipteronia sinensis]
MQVEHGLHLLYTKAWREKDHAEASVFGHPGESFKMLLAYCHRLKEVNPETITAIKTNVANQFEYMFIAHAASLHGFQTVIQPIIAIDGTHLKGKFSGIMFVAICLDANNQVFPLAYGFGDVEDEMSWSWFLNELKNTIGSPEDCMIISDRHLGIKAAVEKVYPNVLHGYCVFHMAQNIKNDYKRKDDVMLEMMKVNMVAFEELMNVGPERWSRAYSPVRRYRLMTSSIAESINSSLVHALQMYAKKPFQDFCGDCYKTTSWLEAYSGNIFPVGHPSDWNIPQDVRSKVVHPPPFCAQAGRPKKMRFKSAGEHENRKIRNCTICKKSGHNRQNCKNAQPCPSAISATSATLKRPRRPYMCRKCGEEDHNS